MKSVIIVDDDPDAVSRIEQLLEGRCRVTSTTDWATLNRIVFREGCDLILMDVNLPVLNGDALVKVLNSTPSAGIPVGRARPKLVYFSSEDEDTLARLVRETGADGYISKSLRLVQIQERILGLLE